MYELRYMVQRSFQSVLRLRSIQTNGVENDVGRGKVIIVDSTKIGNSYCWNALRNCFRFSVGFGKDITKSKEFYKEAIDSYNGIQGVAALYIAMSEIFLNMGMV